MSDHTSGRGDVTMLLASVREGDRRALDELVPLVCCGPGMSRSDP